MWQRVEYTQTQGRASKKRAQNANQWSESDAAGAGPVAQPPVSARAVANQVNLLLKDLRRTARALCAPPSHAVNTPSFFFRDAMWPAVRAFLDERLAAHQQQRQQQQAESNCAAAVPLTVRLVGLGIGPFSRRESRSSFIQMATFLALCESIVAAFPTPAVAVVAAPESTTATSGGGGDEAERDDSSAGAEAAPLEGGMSATATTEPTLLVEASFFEPLAVDSLHGECCRRLGIAMDPNNLLGAYTPRTADEVVIVFMPHCPWVLMHNTFLANWPTVTTTTAAPAAAVAAEDDSAPPLPPSLPEFLPLRNLLVIGNDLRNAPVLHSASVDTDEGDEDGGAPAKGKSKGKGKGRPWIATSARLISLLRFAEIFPMHGAASATGGGGKKSSHKKNRSAITYASTTKDTAEDHEEGTAGLTGLSRSDVVDSLLDTAVMYLSPDGAADGEVRVLLVQEAKGKSHAIVKKAPELFHAMETTTQKAP